MRPEPGQVLHFSEDHTITRFEPHRAATAAQAQPYVWAVNARRCPDYWFPRQSPRAMAWVEPTSTEVDVAAVLGPGGGQRVHTIEYRWLDAIRTARLYAYRLPAARFRPIDDTANPPAVVATEPVTPLGPAEPVGDLIELHCAAGIQLRVLDNLWGFWNTVITTSLGFSGIRMKNATPAG